MDSIEQAYQNNNSHDADSKVVVEQTRPAHVHEKNKAKFTFGKRKFLTLSLKHKQDPPANKCASDSEESDVENANGRLDRREAVANPVTCITPKSNKCRQVSVNKSGSSPPTKSPIRQLKLESDLSRCSQSENSSEQTTEENLVPRCQANRRDSLDAAIPLSFDVNAYMWDENLTQTNKALMDTASRSDEAAPHEKTSINVQDINVDMFSEEFQSSNHEWDHETNVADSGGVDTSAEVCPDDLSQFYDSSQVMRQIESVISSCDAMNDDASEPACNPSSIETQTAQLDARSQPTTSVTIAKSVEIKKAIGEIREHEDNWDETIASGISQLFKSSQYKREVACAFNNFETSICHIAEGQDDILRKDTALGALDHTTADNTVANLNWSNDSMVANTTTITDRQPTQLDAEFSTLGPFYGLPLKVKELIHQYKGIDELYDWQDECLKLEVIRKRKNLVYALPTSGGKTLVSEILIMREIMCRKHNVIFVLPFVSIVQEKVWALSPFALSLDFLVEEYAAGKGGYPPRKRRHKRSVYVATIEKALGLVNSLMETGRLKEIGLVVVDELHLIGESNRGVRLEILLTKLMYAKENIHIIGMSATIGNLPDVCKFMAADVYTKDFRPVELKEYVKCEKQIYAVNRTAKTIEESLVPVRTENFQYAESISAIDPDRLTGLVMEVVPTDSCLVFCATKKNCENVALLLCRIMFKSMLDHKKTEKASLLKLVQAEGSLCPVLKRTLPYGVAYHHSGLTSDERRLIEDAFRVGTLCVICCTSTLAAGVNLPAKRVLLRSPYVGQNFINLARYKQMVGRAGRTGMGEVGESILVCDPRDLRKVAELLCSPMDQVESRMCEDDLKGVRDLVLTSIALGTAHTRVSLRQVISCTLFAVQEQRFEQSVKSATDQAITELFKLSALQLESDKASVPDIDVTVLLQSPRSGTPNSASSERKQVRISNDAQLVVSKLGRAAIKGGLDLDTAHILYEDLEQAQKSLVLANCLHLLYLVTPYDLARQVKPSLPHYYSVFVRLNRNEILTARVLGLNEACEVGLLAGRCIKAVNERVLYRFYLTLMLYDLWNGKPVFEVAEKYEVNRGIVQQLMVSAATFASNVVRFCAELDEFWAFVDLLNGMSQRLQHCSSKELLPLMELPSVKQGRAKQLFRAGYKSLQSIARANPADLMDNISHMSRRIANQMIASAKLLLLEKVENLREEAEDVLDGIEVPQTSF